MRIAADLSIPSIALLGGAAVAPAVFTAFDPATKTAGATLSNNNLTLTANAALNGTAYSASSKTTGLFVVQWTIVNKVDANLDFGLGLRPVSGGGPGIGNDGVGCFGDGTCYNNSFTTQAALGVFVNGDVGTMAANLNTRLVWFRKNSGLWNASAAGNPDTGVGGYPFSSLMTPGSALFLSALSVQLNAALTLNPNPAGTGLTTFGGWS